MHEWEAKSSQIAMNVNYYTLKNVKNSKIYKR